jgi:hypothetical protein
VLFILSFWSYLKTVGICVCCNTQHKRWEVSCVVLFITTMEAQKLPHKSELLTFARYSYHSSNLTSTCDSLIWWLGWTVTLMHAVVLTLIFMEHFKLENKRGIRLKITVISQLKLIITLYNRFKLFSCPLNKTI